MDYKEKYEDLLYYYRERGYKIEKLENQINKLSDKLSSAEFKIETELEPRIQREKRSYDIYVTSGCFTGTNGEPCKQDCGNCDNTGCEENPDYGLDEEDEESN